jgi:hypothetical protein
MTFSERLRDRYLREPLPAQLGHIAGDLSRLADHIGDVRGDEVIAGVLREVICFLDWSIPLADLARAAILVELQRALAGWGRLWLQARAASGPDDPMRLRRDLSDIARTWSDMMLALSGLLSE